MRWGCFSKCSNGGDEGNDDVVGDGDYVDDGDDYDGDNGDYEMIRNLWSVFVGESH